MNKKVNDRHPVSSVRNLCSSTKRKPENIICNCVHNCDGRSLVHSFTAVQMYRFHLLLEICTIIRKRTLAATRTKPRKFILGT